MISFFNFFAGIIYSYFGNGGVKTLVSFSGGSTDFFTVLWLMVTWYIGVDILGNLWLFDFSGIILVYAISRLFAIGTVLCLNEKFTRNQRKRYLKAKLWLAVPYFLMFALAFLSNSFVKYTDNWVGDKWGNFD